MKVGKDVISAKQRMKNHETALKNLARITIRVTEEEKNAVIAMARKEGMTINTFLKFLLIKKIFNK